MAVKFVKGGLQSYNTNTIKKKKVETATKKPVEYPLEKPGQNNKVPAWRQELADARAKQAGVEPINLRTNMTATETGIRKNIQDTQLQKDIQASQKPQLSPEQISALNNLGQLNPEQQNRKIIQGEGIVDTAIAGGGAVAGGVAGGIAGAKLGALAAPFTGGASIPILAGAGAVIGAGIGYFSKVTVDQRQDVKQSYATYLKASSNMNYIINQVNAGNMGYNQATDMWAEELANFGSAEANLKDLTKSKLGRELSGAMDERAKLEAFRRRIPQLETNLALAIASPDPTKIIQEFNTEDVQQ